MYYLLAIHIYDDAHLTDLDSRVSSWRILVYI